MQNYPEHQVQAPRPPYPPSQPAFPPPPAPSDWQAPVPRQQPAKKRRPWLWIVGALAVLLVIGMFNAVAGSGSAPASAPPGQAASSAQPTRASAPTSTPAPTFAHFGDGTFIVGRDIQPGTYRTRQGSASCYYARLKGFGGTVDEIIANDNTDDTAIVTIAASDKGFQSTGCGTWTKDLSRITSSKTTFGDGMYLVGTDIAPGMYKSSGQTGCYYARLSGFGGTIDDILANNNTDSSAILTISASDKGFQSTRCGTWTKV